MKPATTTDAVKILHKRYIKGNAARRDSVQNEKAKIEIAQQVYELRTKANLTQKQLAVKVGTTQSVISRLEDADYSGHSLKMLRRIAGVLNCRVEVRLVPKDERTHACA